MHGLKDFPMPEYDNTKTMKDNCMRLLKPATMTRIIDEEYISSGECVVVVSTAVSEDAHCRFWQSPSGAVMCSENIPQKTLVECFDPISRIPYWTAPHTPQDGLIPAASPASFDTWNVKVFCV